MLVLSILSIFFLITRLINLTLLPVFADEAIYIHWAQVIWHDASNRFIPLSDGKPPLFMWLMVPFLKVISNPLFAGRLLSILSGLATLIGVYFLTKKLFSKKTAVLASIFVILQPFLLFYDRMAIVDSLLTAFGIWSFYLAFLLFEKPNIGRGLLLGTLWGGAMLTKPTGGYFAFLTPPFFWLTPIKKWFVKIKKLFIPSLLASGYALGFFNILRLSAAFPMIKSRSIDYMRTKQDFLTKGLEYIPDTAGVMLFWLVDYFSWFAIAGLVIVLIFAFQKREKKIGLLFLWSIFPFLLQAVIGKIIYPRYLLITAPFWLIILSWGVEQIGINQKKKLKLSFWSEMKWSDRIFFMIDKKFRRGSYRPAFAGLQDDKNNSCKKFIIGLLVGLMLINWLYFDFWLLKDPSKAPLNGNEKEQYLYEWSAGYGIKEIADYIKALPRERKVVVATEGYFGTLPNGLQIYLDRVENIDIFGVGQPIGSFNEKILKAVEEGKETFLVVNSTRLKFESPRLQLIAEYPKPEGPKGQEKLLFFKFLQPF